jgi:hypothetical protein
MYNTTIGTAAVTGGGALAYTGVSYLWTILLVGFACIVLGAYSIYRSRKEERIAQV